MTKRDITSYEYDKNGKVLKQINANGTVDGYEYDDMGQLIKQTVSDKAGDALSYIEYEYDEAGNVTNKTSSYTREVVSDVKSVDMTYDKANRLVTYNGETVTYDAEGNMTYGPDAEGVMTHYTYNCRNMLIEADGVQYEYDPEGNRTAQIDTTTGKRTEYVVDDNSNTLTATETQNGTTQVTTYTYGKGLISQYNETNGYLTFHYNNIGSTMMLTDENGNVNEEYSYGPYGELLSGDASNTTYLYNGEYGFATDANGLYYMRARYYNVAIKRFINQDVITGTIDNSSSLNKYAYVQRSVKQVAKSGKRVTKHVAKKVITKSKVAVKGAKKAVKNTVEKVAKKGKNIKKASKNAKTVKNEKKAVDVAEKVKTKAKHPATSKGTGKKKWDKTEVLSLDMKYTASTEKNLKYHTEDHQDLEKEYEIKFGIMLKIKMAM